MLQLRQLGYRYPTATVSAVHDVDSTAQPGALVLVTGATGCGKSTLLRLVAGLLQRHGRGQLAGSVRLDGVDPAALPPHARVVQVALVGQDPDDQRVAATVGDEIAFAAESAGLAGDVLEARVAALTEALGLPGGPDRPVGALSSGQRPRLSVAAALSAGARVLLLDEPLAHLDPHGAAELVERLRRLADEGLVVLVVEHRLEPLWPVADRIWGMVSGALVVDAAPATLGPADLRALGLSPPSWMQVAEAMGAAPAPPAVAPPAAAAPEVRLRATGVTARFPSGEGVHDVHGAVHAGERIALVGPNGAGKSTLLRAFAAGGPAVHVAGGRLVAVPANPDLGLFGATVAEELDHAAAEHGLGDRPARVARLAAAFDLTPLLDRAPQSLSRGQRLRVSVAAAVAAEPAVLLLDEPTAGQDLAQVERLMGAVRATLGAGALVFATHDLGLARRHATGVWVLDHGRLRDAGAPEGVLARLEDDGRRWLPWLDRRCLELGLPPGSPAAVAAALRDRGLDAAVVAPEAERRRSARLAPVAGAATVDGAPVPRPTAFAALGGPDPRTRLFLVGVVGVLAVSLDAPRALGALVLAALVAFAATRPGGRAVAGAAAVLAAMVWSTVLSQGLFYAEQPRVALVSAGPLVLWREGVGHGLTQSLRFGAMTLAGLTLAASTAPERLFTALRALWVPFGLAFLVVTGLRFVPDVAGEWVAVRDARARRGRPAWKRPPWAWLALELRLLTPLLARALRRARALAESLDARGFDATAPRAVRRPLRARAVDFVLVGLGGLVALGAGVPRLLYVLYTSDTWYHPALRPLYAAVRAWL